MTPKASTEGGNHCPPQSFKELDMRRKLSGRRHGKKFGRARSRTRAINKGTMARGGRRL